MTKKLTPRCIADVYRGLFKFGVFNAVQSSCFDKVSRLFRMITVASTADCVGWFGWKVMKEDDNLVRLRLSTL